MKAIKFICIIIVVCMLFGCAKINRISHFGTDIPEYTAESIILTTDNYSNTINSISQDAETDTFVETDFESNEVITSENTTKPKETKPATSKVTDSSDSTPIETNPIVTTPTETEPIIEETTAIEETEPTIVETEIIETTVFDIINTETIETAIDDTSINTNEDVIYITMIRSMGYYSGQHIVLGGVEIIINDGRKWSDIFDMSYPLGGYPNSVGATVTLHLVNDAWNWGDNPSYWFNCRNPESSNGSYDKIEDSRIIGRFSLSDGFYCGNETNIHVTIEIAMNGQIQSIDCVLTDYI